ncbi:MAG: GTPase domain-containing protein [Candidatus Thorarchaeota archaeon]
MTEPIREIAIAIIGEPQVGKTELIHLLNDKAESSGIATRLKSKDFDFAIWELQTSSSTPEKLEIFSRSFLRDSRPFYRYLLIVTDSTKEDVSHIKYSLRFLRESFPETRFAIVANKQDLDESLSKSHIEKMTNLPTLEISAIDPENRTRLVNFLSYLIGSYTGL